MTIAQSNPIPPRPIAFDRVDVDRFCEDLWGLGLQGHALNYARAVQFAEIVDEAGDNNPGTKSRIDWVTEARGCALSALLTIWAFDPDYMPPMVGDDR